MNLIEILKNEFEQEVKTTEKFLKIVPAEKFDWKPHPKSMSLKQLSSHIAEIPGWVYFGLTSDVLDFSVTPYTPPNIQTNEKLIEIFEKSVSESKSVLKIENESLLNKRWVMKNGAQIWMDITKAELIRQSLSQMIHHRAQLGVYLRLLDIPIPGSYGPSADEKGQ